jgi:plastocyanin
MKGKAQGTRRKAQSTSVTRREMLGGLALAAAWPAWSSAQEPVTIRLAVNYPNGQYYFDPVGVFVPVGGTVRWQFPFRGGIGALMGITISAFHPANDNHELRIPEQAQPFDSGPMNKAVDGFIRFDHTFTVEGTYDYFSASHEVLGMVGRIVVGRPGGPAEKPLGYGGRDGRAPTYPTAVAVLAACPAAEIVAKKTIAYPRDAVLRLYPFGQRQ